MPVIPNGSLPNKVRDVMLSALASWVDGGEKWVQAGAEVIIISPWVSDVSLPAVGESPFAELIPKYKLPIDNKFSSYIEAICTAGARVTLITLPASKHSRDLGKNSKQLATEMGFLTHIHKCGTEIKLVNDLHLKLLLTKEFVIHGSANFTHNGLYKNKEMTYLVTGHPNSIEIGDFISQAIELTSQSTPWVKKIE